jgi:demethylmenaquinone methyltransferase / 2-methoxy-6-polyprenyl-1,4-benzoquinol methylase
VRPLLLKGRVVLHVARDRNRFAQRLFTPLPDRYDRLAELLSFGQNGRWRTAMVGRLVPDTPDRVLDVACGTAGVALQVVSRTSAAVVGVDITLAMLQEGHRRVEVRENGDRIQLVTGSAERLPFPDRAFDALTFTYLLRYVDDPQATLIELARVVKPGGMIASLEFLVPPNPFWHWCWWAYTRAVLPIAGWMTGGTAWFDVGRFLGPNISAHYRRFPVSWTVDAWRRAGIDDVQVREMSLGGGLVMSGRRRRD